MAFDRHMNIVLGDSEEFRKLPPKKGQADTEVCAMQLALDGEPRHSLCKSCLLLIRLLACFAVGDTSWVLRTTGHCCLLPLSLRSLPRVASSHEVVKLWGAAPWQGSETSRSSKELLGGG